MNKETKMTELASVAEAYQNVLVPALFGQWPDLLVDAIGLELGQKVLDVACGTGVLTRTMVKRVGSDGEVVGVDINPAMLAVARKSSSEVDWQEASAEALPFDEGVFDAVASQFGLMLFPAPAAALQEMARVLTDNGRLGLIVFDSLNHMPAYAALADVYEKVVGKDVADALRSPFSMHEAALEACLRQARFNDFEISRHEGLARFPSVRAMVLADVQGWFPFAKLQVDDREVELVIGEAEAALAPFRSAEGELEFPLPVHMAKAIRHV